MGLDSRTQWIHYQLSTWVGSVGQYLHRRFVLARREAKKKLNYIHFQHLRRQLPAPLPTSGSQEEEGKEGEKGEEREEEEIRQEGKEEKGSIAKGGEGYFGVEFLDFLPLEPALSWVRLIVLRKSLCALVLCLRNISICGSFGVKGRSIPEAFRFFNFADCFLGG